MRGAIVTTCASFQNYLNCCTVPSSITIIEITVFHRIADLAMTKGKTHAACYYMETILNRLSEFPNKLAEIIKLAKHRLLSPLAVGASVS